MATNLQVNANTQQAVGAFNNLANAIANARGQFAGLANTMNAGVGIARNYGGSITAINSVFSNLMNMASGALGVIQKLGTGVLFVFKAVISELDKLQGFTAILSVSIKDATDAAASYDFLRKTADRLGVQFDTMTANYAKLVAALPQGTKGLQIAEKALMGVTMAARTLHATNADTQLMFYAITQIASKGVVSMEELRRQLGEKLPGVMQIAAKALNTLPEQLEAAIRKGVVSSEKFLPIFGDALIRTFGDSSEKASQSVSASINRLTNVWVDFVKAILDSGAGNSIIGIFDTLREKLQDPYIIERFSLMIKNLAEQFTGFIAKITQEDLRNGFDVATRAIEMMVNVIGKLITGLTWIINNSGKAGAILGALGGASAGALFGPIGAAVGLAAGAGVGAYVGSQVAPTTAQTDARAANNAGAEAAKAMQAREREIFKFNALIPLLQNFKNLNSFNGLDNLFKAENLNTKTLVDLNRVLTSKEFRSDAERAQGVKDYAKYGVVVGPGGNQLSDVLGAGKPKKKSGEEKTLEASEMRAFGLNPNVQKELTNYLTLLKQGKLNMEQYTDAVQTLITKQPYMIEYQKQLAETESASNKATSEHITSILKMVSAKEELKSRLEDELRLAQMYGPALELENQVTAEVNRQKQAGYDMLEGEIKLLREKIQLINETRQLSTLEGQIVAATLDKYKPQVDTFKALENVKKKEPNFQQTNAQDYLVQQNPALFQGTQEAMDAQKRATQDMYAFIDRLRRGNYISEATMIQMKARLNADAQQQQLSMYSSYYGSLSSLMKSSNRKLFEIGKAAAISQALVDGYGAIQKAYNSAPYPYNLIAAATTAVQVYSNVQSIRSTQGQFMDGGYTGDGPRGRSAGVVHGQEFVVNSSATARNRAALEAMNAGRTVTNAAPGPNVMVVVNNNAEGTVATQRERDTPDGRVIEVMIEKVVVRQVERGGPISDAFSNKFGLNRAAGATR